MIIKSRKTKNNLTNIFTQPLFIIDDWVLTDNILDAEEQEYDRYFSSLLVGERTGKPLTFNYTDTTNEKRLLNMIKLALKNKKPLPNKIIIYINNNIKPNIVLLKHFTCIPVHE